MFALALRVNEVGFLRFDKILKTKTGIYITVYRSKTDDEQTIRIDKFLNDRIDEYKRMVIDNNKYKFESRSTTRGEKIQGYFIFNQSSQWVLNKFNKTIPELLNEGFDVKPY